ncbi:MAG: Fe-S cluster assembly protein SufD, partial [Candidatus Aenigmarchaeota archaeon]|nr:Fe-S cluster assembly protein SufD [Candidatus Aenigmarchaeota archaeon]
FFSLPLPSEREEAWRYTTLGNMPIEPSSGASLEISGKFASFMSAETEKLIPDAAGEDKFDFFNKAFWTTGYAVVVPDNADAGIVEVRIAAGITRSIVILGKGAKAEIVEHISGGSGVTSNFLYVAAEENSRAGISSISDLSDGARDFSYKRAFLGKNSSVTWNVAQFGSALSRIKVDNHFNGEGSSSRVAGLFGASGSQHMDLTTNAFHNVPNTSCKMDVKGALKGSASHVYRGLIKIEKAAKNTSSYLSDHALALSENASANSIPSLMIDNNDVQCGHSASVGNVDEEKLLYLMSRGLDRKKAENLVVEGFFTPMLAAVTSEKMRSELARIVRERIILC